MSDRGARAEVSRVRLQTIQVSSVHHRKTRGRKESMLKELILSKARLLHSDWELLPLHLKSSLG